jgi:hypothetical protein
MSPAVFALRRRAEPCGDKQMLDKKSVLLKKAKDGLRDSKKAK